MVFRGLLYARHLETQYPFMGNCSLQQLNP